jgi:hypothetical protein
LGRFAVSGCWPTMAGQFSTCAGELQRPHRRGGAGRWSEVRPEAPHWLAASSGRSRRMSPPLRAQKKTRSPPSSPTTPTPAAPDLKLDPSRTSAAVFRLRLRHALWEGSAEVGVTCTCLPHQAFRCSTSCFLTDKSYRTDIVSSRKNLTDMDAVCKCQIGSLWRCDGPEEHLLDVVDLCAQGNKV